MIIGGIAITLSLVLLPHPKPTGKYEYTVTIGKEVNLLEFNKKYEIVKQDGELWIIKDKYINIKP
jgi:hypothetical protein